MLKMTLKWAREVPGLEPIERLVLVVMASFCDPQPECTVALLDLAEICGVTERTAKRYISKLRLRKLITAKGNDWYSMNTWHGGH